MTVDKTVRSRLLRRPRTFLAATLITIAAISLTLYQATPTNNKPTLAIDWRLQLTIHNTKTGTEYSPPPNIGTPDGPWYNHTLDTYGPEGYSPLSTRDNTGTIYIQSKVCDPTPRGYCPTFTLGDFFNIWGQQFNRRCVPDGTGEAYCTGHGNPPNPPPLMSNGDARTCIDRSARLSNGQHWLIITSSNISPNFCP